MRQPHHGRYDLPLVPEAAGCSRVYARTSFCPAGGRSRKKHRARPDPGTRTVLRPAGAVTDGDRMAEVFLPSCSGNNWPAPSASICVRFPASRLPRKTPGKIVQTGLTLDMNLFGTSDCTFVSAVAGSPRIGRSVHELSWRDYCRCNPGTAGHRLRGPMDHAGNIGHEIAPAWN